MKTRPQKNVDTGEFPYPLSNQAEESRYLTWVRNHSNYMAERGLLDYLRVAAVLVRGILINFLTLLPYLLLLSLLVGLAYKTVLLDWADHVKEADSMNWFLSKEVNSPGWAKSLQDAVYKGAPTPFLVTPIIIGIAAFWVLIFPIVARLSTVRAFKKSLETGSSSSVKKRDFFERTFGALLLAIIAIVLIELLPLLVHFFHEIRNGALGWTLPAIAGVTGALVAANKILPMLGRVAGKLAIVLVGGLGLVVPLLVVFFVVEFLVYKNSYNGYLNLALLLVPILIALSIVAAMILGRNSLKEEGWGKLSGMLVGMLGLFVMAIVVIVMFMAADGSDPKTFLGKYGTFIFVLAWTFEIWLFCWLTIDVNLTGITGLYRDRLASAFLVGVDTRGDVDIEQDIDLQDICNYDAGSTAPYHLVNVALNLQGSKDIAIRERNSDFFIFSKRFIGSERTGYSLSENMEQVYPQIDLGTAMAISAAAASPNMGRGTNPLMVAFLTLLNVRLGYWIPNPDRVEKFLSDKSDDEPVALTFSGNVFPCELAEIKRRREQAYPSSEERPLDEKTVPTTKHGMIGIGFSGGGIRSATINLGIAQVLHDRGVFDHIDYMSTVSGGGYLGSSISTLMRYKTKPVSEISGKVAVASTKKEHVVEVEGSDPRDGKREHRYASCAALDVVHGGKVEAGDRLLKRQISENLRNSLMDRFRWRVRPSALLKEMMSKLDEDHKWLNLSDGGHIENLATIELLRRRCKFIIIGDGEADPNLHFNGLATLIRYARIDLGVQIDIDLDSLRLTPSNTRDEAGLPTDRRSLKHYAVGTIRYPLGKGENEFELGYLLYLKSSFTGDEDEVIMEYRHRNPAFPHESTADQFFDEGQFESYRALGQHIAEQATSDLVKPGRPPVSHKQLTDWFEKLGEEAQANRGDKKVTTEKHVDQEAEKVAKGEVQIEAVEAP